MKHSIHLAICVSTALVAAASLDCAPATTVTVTAGSDTPNSEVSAPSVSDNHMTISVVNAYSSPLSLSLTSNVPGPSPIGNPLAAEIPHSSGTQYVFPTGWAGRITVGPNLNYNGSKIEGSFTGPPDIDVSYVDGYTVPITCSSEGTAVSGCNIDLFKRAMCEDVLEGPVCLNPARFLDDGPASPFFAPCTGAAYTFPNDNAANAGSLGSNLVSCCIGSTCEAPSRQVSLFRPPSEHSAPRSLVTQTATVNVSSFVASGSLKPTAPLVGNLLGTGLTNMAPFPTSRLNQGDSIKSRLASHSLPSGFLSSSTLRRTTTKRYAFTKWITTTMTV